MLGDRAFTVTGPMVQDDRILFLDGVDEWQPAVERIPDPRFKDKNPFSFSYDEIFKVDIVHLLPPDRSIYM